MSVLLGIIAGAAPIEEVRAMQDVAGSDCVGALRALAEGRLSEWKGLPSGCLRTHADAAFGSEPGPDGSGSLGAYRRYGPRPAAPNGLFVWFSGDLVTAIEITGPLLASPPAQILGEPEAKEPSLLGTLRKQWIYASRGLTLHVSPGSHDVFRLYAYLPTTVDEYRRSPLARVESRRIPLRR